MVRELAGLVAEARLDRSIHAAVLTGAGSSFSAGADLSELAARQPEDSFSLASRDFFDLWATTPWPTVAAVNGPALGGGFELALACDVRVCSPNARFALPEVRRGVLPAAGGIRRLVAELGAARAKEIVLFGKTLDAAQAASWGIVSEVTENFAERAVSLAERIDGPDPMTVQVAKMLFEQQMETLAGRQAEAIAQALFYGRRSWENRK